MLKLARHYIGEKKNLKFFENKSDKVDEIKWKYIKDLNKL